MHLLRSLPLSYQAIWYQEKDWRAGPSQSIPNQGLAGPCQPMGLLVWQQQRSCETHFCGTRLIIFTYIPNMTIHQYTFPNSIPNQLHVHFSYICNTFCPSQPWLFKKKSLIFYTSGKWISNFPAFHDVSMMLKSPFLVAHFFQKFTLFIARIDHLHLYKFPNILHLSHVD